MKEISPTASLYFIALVLPPQLDEQILLYKKWMKENYGCKVGLKSPAHITIAPPFWMPAEKESVLKLDIESVADLTPAFTLTTNNFSAFKPRTIFVAVQESEELNALKNAADRFFRHTEYKLKIENRPFHPHITVATRDMQKKDFADAWPHFQQKSLVEKFSASGLSLLKHNGQKWEVVFTAPFRWQSAAKRMFFYNQV